MTLLTNPENFVNHPMDTPLWGIYIPKLHKIFSFVAPRPHPYTDEVKIGVKESTPPQ